MTKREFVPNSKYQIKMMLMITLIAFLVSILLAVGIAILFLYLGEGATLLSIYGVAIIGVALVQAIKAR